MLGKKQGFPVLYDKRVKGFWKKDLVHNFLGKLLKPVILLKKVQKQLSDGVLV